MEKEGARFEVIRRLACISREEGELADIKKDDRGKVVMVKTIIICKAECLCPVTQV